MRMQSSSPPQACKESPGLAIAVNSVFTTLLSTSVNALASPLAVDWPTAGGRLSTPAAPHCSRHAVERIVWPTAGAAGLCTPAAPHCSRHTVERIVWPTAGAAGLSTPAAPHCSRHTVERIVASSS